MLDERESLPKAEASHDLIQLINYILRKFFKKISDDPFVIVETLGPKSRNKWKDLSSYRSEDEDGGDGMGGQRARIREKVRVPFVSGRDVARVGWVASSLRMTS